MRRPRSLRAELLLGLSAGILVVWLIATVAAGLAAREELDEVFDDALQQTAERLLPLARLGPDPGDTAEVAATSLPRSGAHAQSLSYLIRDAGGLVWLRSANADPAIFAGPAPPGFHSTADHRIFALPDATGRWTIEVAEPLANRREAVRETVNAFLLPLILVLPMSLLLAAWRTRKSLARLDRLSAEVQRRDASDLRLLATPDLQAELLPIRDAVNRLMARLRRALETERSFTANAAHELRTPLAATLAQTQRLVAEAPEGPLRARARRVEDELHRLARISEKLLQLSRAESGGGIAAQAADLAPILALVVEDLRPPGPDRLRLRVAPLVSDLDPDAFAILARNLIENALLHGDAAAPVEIALEPGGLRVVNAGVPVAPEVLARLGTRFQRGATSAGGSGLGLAIAASIARGAGWRLELHSPAPGRPDGFEARAIPPQIRTT